MRPFYTPHQLRHDQDDILFINEHWDEIKEAYFQVLEALKAPSVEAPETPTPESGCKCPWVKKTLIPTYFYITLDDTAKDLTDSDVEEIIKNTDVTVTSHVDLDRQTASIPKQFPLIYLGKTAEGYKYAFPYSLADNRNDSTGYDTGHEKNILIQLHNRLSQYNTEGSSYMHGFTQTNGTRIYRDSYGVGGKWPATNKIILSLAADDYTIYRDLDSERVPQDTAKVYYYKHIANEIEPVPMTFEFLETVRQCGTEVEDKPEDTPDTPDTPDIPENDNTESALTARTLKAKFTPEYWYNNNPKFAAYCIDTQTWKEATKVVDDVVYYTFTEEEAIDDSVWIFTRHKSDEELSWYTKFNQTQDVAITFDDTVMNDVITIDETDTTRITVGSAYV